MLSQLIGVLTQALNKNLMINDRGGEEEAISARFTAWARDYDLDWSYCYNCYTFIAI
jgi:hypothetical protein